MRQAWDRWKASIRNRMLDTWWLIREGPRAGNWRPVLGVVLPFRSMAREPVTTIPAEDGIPPVDISEESTSFVGDPLVEPEVRGRTIAAESQAPDGSERGERSKDENDRDKPEKDPSPEPSPT